jgi:methylenetetrahydrofolate dehydrogenase (NADP+)/methenyltetrahydrofolate cyclohydrolase
MIIDGKAIADELLEEYARKVHAYKGRSPCLAVVIVGENPASHVYVNLKIKACHRTGIQSKKLEFPNSISEAQLLKVIDDLNRDSHVDGILVQMPLPPQINPIAVTDAIDPDKDVDGFHPLNVGKLSLGDPTGFVPCTPLGVMEILRFHNINPSGKYAVVVGRSSIVGKPMVQLLLAANATVTTVHSKTANLADFCRQADILIAAAGKPNLITKDMVKKGAIVIDVGVNKVNDATSERGYRLVGDVDFEQVQSIASSITPVPGGVGPMTIAMLMHNTLRSYQKRCNES